MKEGWKTGMQRGGERTCAFVSLRVGAAANAEEFLVYISEGQDSDIWLESCKFNQIDR